LSRPLEDCGDAPRSLEFAILVWTIPAPVVQIHIAIPAPDASGRVERLHHSANSLKRGPPAFILNLNFPAVRVVNFPPSGTPSPFPVHAGHHAKLNAQPAETLQSRSRTPITLALKKPRVDELLAHLAGMPF
jgi:hypothetical protein